MYKEDLALDNLQWLMCHKTNLNQTKISIGISPEKSQTPIYNTLCTAYKISTLSGSSPCLFFVFKF